MMTFPPIKFLLVDDLEANLIALEGLLRRDGLELLKAHSAPEALELLLVHDVSLALLDVQMPGMDGFELAELMRGAERTRRVPIIFVTAGALDQQRRFRGYDAGAVDFLFKPIEPHILQSKAQIFFELARQRDALRRSAEEAQTANRAKDDFLASLSHELRTPLTPVLLTATALESDPALPESVRAQLNMMRRNIELEARLIDDLLDITRIIHGKLTIAPTAVDVHQLIHHAAEIVRVEAMEKNIHLEFKLEARRHHTEADPTRIQQVFWNLLKNAVKFTPAGGTVTVLTSNDTGGGIAVSVRDSGVGISAGALPRIFTAFEQGDVAGQHRYGGLGLGLAISKAIVDVHHGAIHATSPGAGMGATFTVTLAAIDPPADTADGSPVRSQARREMQVLLVEDHEATRTVLGNLLARNRCAVTAVSSVQDALEACSGKAFDAVISDLGLPDGSGLDLMRQLRGKHTIAGIALSGYGMEEDRRQSEEAGFFAHLVKPVNFDHLREILDQLASRL